MRKVRKKSPVTFGLPHLFSVIGVYLSLSVDENSVGNIMSIAKSFFSLIVIAALCLNAAAFETDQFNLPDKPLADIGDEVSEYVRENVEKAMAKLNARISRLVACGENRGSDCPSSEKTRAELARLRSPEAIAREVFKLLGDGVPPYTKSGSWMEKHEFRAQPARFKTSLGDSIHRTMWFNYYSISETVRLYGVEFGTDKIAHIFQQGFTYWRIAEKGRGRGRDEKEAVSKAVDWGRLTEKTYYGFFVSMAYSNGDLAANFAGMKFYERLAGRTKIGDTTLEPLVTSESGLWRFRVASTEINATILRPFISTHLNEALNPNVYLKLFWVRSTVEKTVREKACPKWKLTYPEMNAARFRTIESSHHLWFGEDYGFRDSSKRVMLDAVCFSD